MIAWMLMILMSTMLGTSVVCMVVRMRAVQEFSCYLGRMTRFRACAEGMCVIATRMYHDDRALQRDLKKMRSCMKRIEIPGENSGRWWGLVSYELTSDDLLEIEVTLCSSSAERPLLRIQRVVEPFLFEYTNSDAEAPNS
jgi:hypothetical protein